MAYWRPLETVTYSRLAASNATVEKTPDKAMVWVLSSGGGVSGSRTYPGEPRKMG
jgi:hypothetical protein